MMKYQTRIPSLGSVTTTHYTPGADHLYYANTATGDLWWMPLNPAAQLVSRIATPLARGATLNLNVFGSGDLQWDSTGKNLVARNFARVLSLPAVTSLSSVTPAMLVDANWASVANNNSIPEDGTSSTGRFYAIRIPYGSEFHYAKLRIYKVGTQTQVDWSTYSVSPNPYRVSAGLSDVRDIVVSDNETALYFTGRDANGDLFVLQAPRTSNGLTPYPEFSSQPQPIHYTPLQNPQQLVLDADFLYVLDDNTLWRIQLSTQERLAVVQGFTGGRGLLLSSQGALQTAYISDAQGKLFVVDLSDFNSSLGPQIVSSPTYRLGGQTGFLAWANPEKNALYVPLPDSRQVARIDLPSERVSIDGTTLTGIPGPRSIEVISNNTLYVACGTELGQFSRTIEVSNNLLLGIGLIPFQYITNSELNPASPGVDDGKADTSSTPGYYFSDYPNLAFAGRLSVMVNHAQAWNTGIRFFNVKLKNLTTNLTRPILDPVYDHKWDATAAQPKFVYQTTLPTAGAYPIRNPDELWYNPHLGVQMNTSLADNGHNVLTVEFLDANGQLVPGASFSRLLFIDNTHSNAQLYLPRIGTNTVPPTPNQYPTLECGCLAYATKNDLMELDFAAWHPQGVADYTLSVVGGGRYVDVLTHQDTVTTTSTKLTHKQTSASKPIRAGHILGNCDVANVSIHLSVPSRVIDGFGWVNLGAYAAVYFTLIKGPVTHSPWTEPA
ncbi:hypothetical protein F0U62_47005 [Cystobacter fuscus]|uniref:hypothetical protein n=1 Tax=Cystobacter fuscus TaxID=43 RepID=UPI002B2D7A49|nr:hypothetical protein F0U62_47005 [Cystobacter fuscus]